MCKYIGTLDNKYLKEEYGIQICENGDKYFGQFTGNDRNKNRIYFWGPTKNENRNSIRNIFLKLENEIEYENANFDV